MSKHRIGVVALFMACSAIVAVAGCGRAAHGNAARGRVAPVTASPSPSRQSPGPPTAKPISAGATPTPTSNMGGPGRSIRRTGNATVALTFDDGPDPVNTPALLDVLKENGVKATFCLVGFRARDYPDIVRRIAAEGHTLCNHSWQHLLNLAERDDSYLWWDLNRTNEAIRAAVPDAKIEYFRAPGGHFTDRLTSFSDRLAMKPIYWHVDDECWKVADYGKGQRMVDHITWVVQHQTRPGSIILSHDNAKPHTVAAYRTLVPWLKSRFALAALPTS